MSEQPDTKPQEVSGDVTDYILSQWRGLQGKRDSARGDLHMVERKHNNCQNEYDLIVDELRRLRETYRRLSDHEIDERPKPDDEK